MIDVKSENIQRAIFIVRKLKFINNLQQENKIINGLDEETAKNVISVLLCIK